MAKSNVSTALYEFERCLKSAERIYQHVRDDCRYGYESINERVGSTVAQRIVGLAFVGIVAGWEDFLQQTFLRYMTGSASPNGASPRLLLGPCRSLFHAQQVLAGGLDVSNAEKRQKWNDYKWVERTAAVFFCNGDPFRMTDVHVTKRIETAVKIRNRVVHNSAQAKKQFKAAANQVMGQAANAPLPRGFSPGRLLTLPGGNALFPSDWMSRKDMAVGDLFEAYLLFFWDTSGLIVTL